MSKMMHDQPSAAVPASRDRRNFLIAGAGLALAATTLGRSGAVMAKPAIAGDKPHEWTKS